jgi:hypothetical protein
VEVGAEEEDVEGGGGREWGCEEEEEGWEWLKESAEGRLEGRDEEG